MLGWKKPAGNLHFGGLVQSWGQSQKWHAAEGLITMQACRQEARSEWWWSHSVNDCRELARFTLSNLVRIVLWVKTSSEACTQTPQTQGAMRKQADSAAHTERGSQGRQTSEKSIVSG